MADGAVTFITLGPTGTCHERAVERYAEFQGIEDYGIELIVDFFVGLEMLRETPGAFLVQCSAHPKVHEITEKYWTEVWVVDTFIYPTKHLVLLSRKEVERPRSLGIVPRDSAVLPRRRYPRASRRCSWHLLRRVRPRRAERLQVDARASINRTSQTRTPLTSAAANEANIRRTYSGE